MPDLEQIVTNIFPQKTVVIVGDLVADQFLSGTISRVSREAPVFIMRHEETATLPGAAANAAANVASLGGKAKLVGVVGSDANGSRLMDALSSADVDTESVVQIPDAPTTTKVRVLAGQQLASKNQVIRIDYEAEKILTEETRSMLRANLTAAIESADGVIVSDYGYGAVFTDLYEDALRLAKDRGVPIIVDSRYSLQSYKGATSATPNREEVENILGSSFTPDDCESLRSQMDLASLLVTNGSWGMTLFEDGRATDIRAVGSLTPVDVTGAGDTVIAAFSLAIASKMPVIEAARIANHAGGVVVTKKRTATVSPQELIASIRSYPDSALSNQA